MARLSLLEFADNLDKVMPTIIREFSKQQEDELYTGKITLPQFFILDFLNREGRSKMTDLANFMDVSTAAMTGIVDRVVRAGYAVRVFDPNDRRLVKISPTLKGLRLVRKVNKCRRNIIIKTFGRISQSEREDYLRILLRIQDTLVKGKK